MTELKRLREMAYDVICGADFEEITEDMDDEEKRDFKVFFSGYYEGYEQGRQDAETNIWPAQYTKCGIITPEE